MSPRVAAIVLAAGRSKRFGRANKLLAILHTQPLIARVMEVLAALPLDETIVVTGRDHDRIAEAVAAFAPRLVNNPNHARGMGTSIATGVIALEPGIDGAFIVQADMPFLSAATLSAQIASFEASERRAIVVPVAQFSGTWGNPVLWPADLLPELAKLDGEEGAKSLIYHHQDRLKTVTVGRDVELTDVDSMDELELAIRISEFEALDARGRKTQ